MALVANEIQQQQSLAMMHDLDNMISRLNTVKSSLLASQTELLNFGGSLDPDSPEMKMIEKRRMQLAAYEKKIDAEIEAYKNKRQIAEARYKSSGEKVQKAIERCYSRT